MQCLRGIPPPPPSPSCANQCPKWSLTRSCVALLREVVSPGPGGQWTILRGADRRSSDSRAWPRPTCAGPAWAHGYQIPRKTLYHENSKKFIDCSWDARISIGIQSEFNRSRSARVPGSPPPRNITPSIHPSLPPSQLTRCCRGPSALCWRAYGPPAPHCGHENMFPNARHVPD